MCAELDDRLAYGSTGRGLQKLFTRSDIELITGRDHRGVRTVEKLGGRGIAHVDGNRLNPSGIGNDVPLPRARDADRDDALPDDQTVCVATEFVDHTDGFNSRHGGELRGESVPPANRVQIAGLDWCS